MYIIYNSQIFVQMFVKTQLLHPIDLKDLSGNLLKLQRYFRSFK